MYLRSVKSTVVVLTGPPIANSVVVSIEGTRFLLASTIILRCRLISGRHDELPTALQRIQILAQLVNTIGHCFRKFIWRFGRKCKKSH